MRESKPDVPVRLEVESPPRRAVAGLNVRHEDKAVFDALQAWWSLERGRPLSQWDAFSILLAAALENPALVVPRVVREAA